jgi:hypothetical protein
LVVAAFMWAGIIGVAVQRGIITWVPMRKQDPKSS